MLAQIRSALETMKQGDSFNRNEPANRGRLIYMLENYEVFFGTFHHSWSFTTQIKGGLNYLLSTKWKLPNYIYIVFSNEQIEEAEILQDEFYTVLDSMFSSVLRSINQRRAVLPRKAKRFRPPQIAVIRTVPKSNVKQNEKNFKNKRRTLNRAIQKVAADFKWRAINIDDILPKFDKHFNERGEELSEEGLRIFWNFLSDDLKRLETRD